MLSYCHRGPLQKIRPRFGAAILSFNHNVSGHLIGCLESKKREGSRVLNIHGSRPQLRWPPFNSTTGTIIHPLISPCEVRVSFFHQSVKWGILGRGLGVGPKLRKKLWKRCYFGHSIGATSSTYEANLELHHHHHHHHRRRRRRNFI